MISKTVSKTFDALLNEQVKAVTLSDLQMERVDTTLQGISTWLHQAHIGRDRPNLYTQGSVRLRTSISPKRGGGFDADVVCEVGSTDSWNSPPRKMFEALGDHLRALPGFSGVLQPKKRCWALIYDPEYHVDITPAIRDSAKGGSAVLVFDEPSNSWRSSDPLGYAAWFFGRASLATGPMKLAGRLTDDLSRVDQHEGRQWVHSKAHAPPIAQAIQLLKRRRDLWFDGPDATNSMVLTTLAAKFYAGEPTVSESLLNLVERIAQSVANTDDRNVVVNPINATEVLSENWIGNLTARRSFVAFITEFRAQLTRAASAKTEGQMAARIDQLFGDKESAA